MAVGLPSIAPRTPFRCTLFNRFHSMKRSAVPHAIATLVFSIVLPCFLPAAPIHDAARAGDLARVRNLLASDPIALDLPSPDGATPLMYAAGNRTNEVVQLLLDQGANANAKDSQGYTALILVALAGRFEMAELLLENGAAVDVKNNSGTSALMLAAQTGRVPMTEMLLKHRAALNATDNAGSTPLMLAAMGGHTEVVRLLLENRAAIDARNHDGVSPLMFAARSGHLEVVKLLLKEGAGFGLGDDGPLLARIAQEKGHAEIAELLTKAVARCSRISRMHRASAAGDVQQVSALLAEDPSLINATDTSGFTPLIFAAAKGHAEVVRVLLDRGAAIDARSTAGGTALMFSVMAERLETVKLLLERGANTQLKAEGRTALQHAEEKGLTEIVDLLRSAPQ